MVSNLVMQSACRWRNKSVSLVLFSPSEKPDRRIEKRGCPKACDGFREHEALADVGVQIRPAIAHPFKQLELVHSRNSKARAGTNRLRSTRVLGLRPCSWKIPCRLSFPQHRACKDFGIDDIARGTLRVGDDLVENIGKLDFILVARDIPDVRRADCVFHLQ